MSDERRLSIAHHDQMGDPIPSAYRLLDHFAIRLSRLFLHFGDLERDGYALCKYRYGCYDLLPVWKLALTLCPHMDEILVLTVDLSPLLDKFGAIVKSTFGDLSSPSSTPSSSPSSANPSCRALQPIEFSILQRLHRIQSHFDTVISLSTPPKLSASRAIDQTIASSVSSWLDHVTSVADNLRDFIRAMDTVFSVTQDASNVTLSWVSHSSVIDDDLHPKSDPLYLSSDPEEDILSVV